MDARIIPMNIIRMKKEVRALFWPWCAAVIAGALPLLLPHSHTAEKVNLVNFFLGIPLLATLSIGNEFQQRTLSLWLTQPCSRMQLWAEKMSVMLPAVLSAGLLSGIALFSSWPQLDRTYQVAASAYFLIMMASAPFWTLAARSTVGGFLLISCFLFIANVFVGGIDKLPGPGEGSAANPLPMAAVTAIFAFAICYAAVLLWLGARKLTRFQVTGGAADHDLLMSGPTMAPAFLVEWFRCRPSGAFLNLLRKEFRLLRPLWLIALSVVLYLTCLATFRLLPSPAVREPRTMLEWALFGPFACLCIVMAGLAGTISLGEERASGTHAWHMTLPISPRGQWLIKLVMAMFSGLACAVLLPLLAMIVVGSVYGSPFMFVYAPSWLDWLLVAPILTLACFWCACAANGSVRAVIWVFPVTAAVFYAKSAGMWLGEELARKTGTLLDMVLASFHGNPLAFTSIMDSARAEVLWLFVPVMLVAVVQSYRLFRTQPQDSVLWMLRCALPLVLVTVLWNFSVSAGFVASSWEPLAETRQALHKLQPVPAKIEISGEDLARNSSLTAPTRRWLEGSRILVVPDATHSAAYVATIDFAGGMECRLTVAHYGGTVAWCGYKGR